MSEKAKSTTKKLYLAQLAHINQIGMTCKPDYVDSYKKAVTVACIFDPRVDITSKVKHS